jgi:hypothetical protein
MARQLLFVVGAAPVALVDDDEVEEVGGYSPKYGAPALGGPLMKVWKMVKKMLPFFGTLPFLRMSSGAMRTRASSGKAEKAL